MPRRGRPVKRRRRVRAIQGVFIRVGGRVADGDGAGVAASGRAGDAVARVGEVAGGVAGGGGVGVAAGRGVSVVCSTEMVSPVTASM